MNTYISQGGGAHPLHPPPRSAPGFSFFVVIPSEIPTLFLIVVKMCKEYLHIPDLPFYKCTTQSYTFQLLIGTTQGCFQIERIAKILRTTLHI